MRLKRCRMIVGVCAYLLCWGLLGPPLLAASPPGCQDAVPLCCSTFIMQAHLSMR